MKTRSLCLMTALFLFMATMTTFSSCSKTEDDDSSQQEAVYIKLKGGNTDITVNAGLQVVEQELESNVKLSTDSKLQVSSSEEWCKVEVCYLPTRLKLNIGGNLSMTERKAVVTLRLSGRRVTMSFNVHQLAGAPFVSFQSSSEGNNQRIDASSKSWSWTLRSNLPYDDLEVISDGDWCQAKLSNSDDTEGVKNYQLTTNISDNMSDKKREAVVTVASKSHECSVSFKVTQDKSTMTASSKLLAFDRDGGNRTVTVRTDVSWKAECDADWITLEQNGNELTIHTSSTTAHRTAQVTFKDRESPAITITQTKYKVGDAYSEDGVTGTVAYIGDDKRFIYKLAGENLQYRLYDDAGQEGATSKDDGRTNTLTVLEIARKKNKSYPAFKAANALNVDGSGGWYLPAINELDKMKSFISGDAWSSTEAYVLSAYYHDGRSAQIKNKPQKLLVYAIKQF